jgi:hypothetical protein
MSVINLCCPEKLIYWSISYVLLPYLSVWDYLYAGEKGIEAVKTWDVRPSLIWAGDDWRPWNENFAKEVNFHS